MAREIMTEDSLAETISERIGFSFTDSALVVQAFTHSSARTTVDYQRLEFVGDRVLGLVIAEMLHDMFPDASEGELSIRLNTLVNAETLSKITTKIGLDAYIITGKDLKSVAARKQVNMRADVMEALIAAIYLQSGLEAARNFVHQHWKKLALASAVARADAKTALQEWAHQVSGGTPTYAIISRSGPDHDPIFEVAVTVKGYPDSPGQGRSKREAEQAAATAMLEREGIWTIE